MKKHLITGFVFVLIVAMAISFTACGKTDNGVAVTGIEITTQPTKVQYFEGDTFDATGMVVSEVKSDSSKTAVTGYTVDKTGALTAADTAVTVTYGGHTATVAITVSAVTVTDVEVSVNNEMLAAGNVSLSALKYRPVYNNGTSGSDWFDVTSDDYVETVVNAEGTFVKISVLVGGQTFEKSVAIGNITYVTVNDLLSKDMDKTFMLEGILVSIAGYPSTTVEYIVLDDATDKMIGVSGITTGKIHEMNIDTLGYKIGDKVRIPVKLAQKDEAAGNSSSKRIYAAYDPSSIIPATIVSHDNTYTLDKTSVPTISSQTELQNYLSAENRPNTFYKLVKLHGKVNYVYYSGAAMYRFFFNGVTSLTEQKVDGASPCFANGAQYYTTGNTIGDLMFGDATVQPTSFAAPASAIQDVYAIFIGGSNYYHEFVVLSASDVTTIEEKLSSVQFTAPTTKDYLVGQTLDLTGAQLDLTYEFGTTETVAVTTEMLTASTIPDMTTAGTFTVAGVYQGFDFSFDVKVQAKTITSIELNGTMPTTSFYVRDWQTNATTVLTAMKITAHYEETADEIIDITAAMVTCDEAVTVGNHEVTVSYLGKSIVLPVTTNTSGAISVADFKTKTEGTFDVIGIVVGPASSHALAELLIKDKTTNDMIGIGGTGVVGKYNALNLDTTVINKGDEIITELTVKQATDDGGNKNKIYGDSNDTFKTKLIVLTNNNQVSVDVSKETFTTISTQDELVTFLNSDTRFYSYVKLVGLKGINYSDSFRIFFGDTVTKLDEQKVNGYSPFLYKENANAYLTEGMLKYFTNSTSKDYTAPVTTTYDIYALFIGGNAYYHDFVIMSDSWFVTHA